MQYLSLAMTRWYEPFDLKGSNRVDKEYLWLPKFASYLPFDIPTPLANGVPLITLEKKVRSSIVTLQNILDTKA